MTTTPAKTEQELFRRRAETWLDRLYLWAAFLLLPLVLHRGSLGLTET